MKTNLLIVSGIMLLFTTIGFALLPITIEKKIKQFNNEINDLNYSIIGIEKNISKTHSFLREASVLSQHIELLLILRREDMVIEKKDELLLHKYTALLSAYNILKENRIIDSICQPPLDFKNSIEFQERFDKYINKGIIFAEKCSEKMNTMSIELNNLELKKMIIWVILISLQGIGLFLGIISKSKKD